MILQFGRAPKNGILVSFYSFLISTLYSKAKVAAACAGIVYFLTYVPYMYVAIKEDVAGDSISAIVKTVVVSIVQFFYNFKVDVLKFRTLFLLLFSMKC